MKETPRPAGAGHEIITSFVRHRNVLLARGSFSELYVDYYLHLAEHGLKHAAAHDTLFKDALAAFVQHPGPLPPMRGKLRRDALAARRVRPETRRVMRIRWNEMP